jgi:hypothetical protein
MALRRCFAVVVVASLAAGCATTIAPNYTSEKPNIMRIGGDRPEAAPVKVENTGSYCVESSERWNEHGKTPDGQSLWARDTLRRVVPCK